MQSTGSVNYHVHSDTRQAFHIDAGGVTGKLISPELAATVIDVKDVRMGDAAVRFAVDSVGFLRAPTKVTNFTAGELWKAEYDRELTDLLKQEVEARDVVIFDHTVRVDDPNSDRKPARNVHSDYSPEGAQQRLIDILGAEKAEDWSAGHYGFINIWRPVDASINSAPLGFVRPSSVEEEDWVLVDLIYPDRLGHIMGLAANDGHEWVYQSRMAPDEVAYFNIYDNRGHPSIAHSAIDLVEDASVHSIRKSIESRTLVRY
ncbi:CmcJ/NvfI family oxidoreductase [Leisingera sp. SS27]|uniref:CmcJ/NvfI family oxidoreductase n=1 Tax=Leisingera sp. SS27 TaxID=2979462 RepID=UPI00232AA7D2|nr:CmcJ/NvfI family oxidoreductase [Leisingera sp. SS27]MDC0659372.1 CmcJ/NvfI family oxidoreductase [Leisingera sp. SS27]